MRIYRIHADSELRTGDELRLSERAAQHLVKVLRHRVGDRVTLFDGKGREAKAEIIMAHRRHGCSVRVLETVEVCRESPLRVELLPGMSRGEKMDLVIQKTVELGVSVIRPIITERSEVRPDKSAAARLSRWKEIVIGACEQCGRAHLPEIHAPSPIEGIADRTSARLVLNPASRTLLDDCPPVEGEISIAIGPEGGFSERDLALLEQRGFRSVRFGPRILRTETASIAAVSALQVLYGDLGKR
ncbi:MAG TPA: 16S rRNA (uracil(1498)-N(3))-methyltransferase [Wenzhouxiangellaceae bacterium]|nr:16S rRNA (uracil(1498)-N(3))-methyltransferase [Wenzhouxiangellaceae bacterium]